MPQGLNYNQLDADGCRRFEGTGDTTRRTPAEGKLCQGCDVIVVGRGNSAGQAAVFLASQARKVLLVIRGDDLNKNMSSYLVRRIGQTTNIELLRSTTVRRLDGNSHLQYAEITRRQDQ